MYPKIYWTIKPPINNEKFKHHLVSTGILEKKMISFHSFGSFDELSACTRYLINLKSLLKSKYSNINFDTGDYDFILSLPFSTEPLSRVNSGKLSRP